MDEQITSRTATPADEEFLFRLFATEKAAEFAPLGWGPEQLRPLLETQWRAREVSYAHSYPAAVNMILCDARGAAVGRHLVERRQECYRTIDIAVLPEHRNRGIGAWALRQLQQMAAFEQVPLRLSVLRTNPALRLYERLGFLRASGNELSYEMEWQPPRAAASPAAPLASADSACAPRTGFDRDAADRILAFLRQIGFEISLGAVPSTSFLPGIQMVRNGLRVDMDALQYPGDLLHEAGHLAVMTPRQRNQEFPGSSEMAHEIAAQAWSYAAALHIGIAPELVFHPSGYKGHAAALLQGFRNGSQTGVPLLAWYGLTTPAAQGSCSMFPRMLRWLRQESSDAMTAAEEIVEIAGVQQ